MAEPLVSIGIPTYNRLRDLKRAVGSALAQDHANLELVISDNASSDGTDRWCRRLAESDPRVRYVRQAINRGPLANFEAVRLLSEGDYYMWLSDDDWLDRSYVSQCVAVLRQDPSCSLACGLPLYYAGEQYVRDDLWVELTSRRRWLRVLRHYYHVVDCGVFYGLMRRQHVPLAALPHVVGCDWIAVGALAFTGKVRTLPGVHIHRQLTGCSHSHASNAAVMRVPKFQGKFPHLSTALGACREILRAPAYRGYGPLARALLAMAAFTTIHVTRTHCVKDLLALQRDVRTSLGACFARRQTAAVPRDNRATFDASQPIGQSLRQLTSPPVNPSAG